MTVLNESVVVARPAVATTIALLFLRVGFAHVDATALYDVTLAAQALSNVGLDKSDKAERAERFRYVDINDLAVLGKVVLEVFCCQVLAQSTHEYLSARLWLLC